VSVGHLRGNRRGGHGRLRLVSSECLACLRRRPSLALPNATEPARITGCRPSAKRFRRPPVEGVHISQLRPEALFSDHGGHDRPRRHEHPRVNWNPPAGHRWQSAHYAPQRKMPREIGKQRDHENQRARIKSAAQRFQQGVSRSSLEAGSWAFGARRAAGFQGGGGEGQIGHQGGERPAQPGQA